MNFFAFRRTHLLPNCQVITKGCSEQHIFKYSREFYSINITPLFRIGHHLCAKLINIALLTFHC